MERPKGLALATIDADPQSAPQLLTPQRGWSRQSALDWLLAHADTGTNMLIGMDLSTALPFCDAEAYFPDWEDSPDNARDLWAMVDKICANDPHLGVHSLVSHPQARRYFRHGKGDTGDRFGDQGTGRLRVVEHHQRRTKQGNSASCFNLVGAAQVGKSSLTGMRLLHRLNRRIPVWPYDAIPDHGPVIIEIYTSIAARAAGVAGGFSKIRDAPALDAALAALNCRQIAPLKRYDDHETDAIITAAWMRTAASDPLLWRPAPLNHAIAAKEGWTFGVF